MTINCFGFTMFLGLGKSGAAALLWLLCHQPNCSPVSALRGG